MIIWLQCSDIEFMKWSQKWIALVSQGQMSQLQEHLLADYRYDLATQRAQAGSGKQHGTPCFQSNLGISLKQGPSSKSWTKPAWCTMLTRYCTAWLHQCDHGHVSHCNWVIPFPMPSFFDDDLLECESVSSSLSSTWWRSHPEKQMDLLCEHHIRQCSITCSKANEFSSDLAIKPRLESENQA